MNDEVVYMCTWIYAMIVYKLTVIYTDKCVYNIHTCFNYQRFMHWCNNIRHVGIGW